MQSLPGPESAAERIVDPPRFGRWLGVAAVALGLAWIAYTLVTNPGFQWDIVGRKKASHEGFSYSSALQAKGGEWTYEDINHMIFKPQGFVRGTKMAFAGLPKAQDRADVIAYLRTMNDNPPPLP